ncbi:MAG: hypothetical protein JW917_01515 [Ignavibacteria bacterium]|nr:hypothetical protein [Ignavibacteria bacterium]
MIKKNIKYVIYSVGIIIGALGGFLYWKYVGCASGTCPLQSSATFMIIYGAIAGVLLASFVKIPKEKS